ncbi:MAG TPA: hypothetical protein ENN19_13255 [Chloroflexi bacterium]|nr:hypothetical protein [Chloroflexota bacterium]
MKRAASSSISSSLHAVASLHWSPKQTDEQRVVVGIALVGRRRHQEEMRAVLRGEGINAAGIERGVGVDAFYNRPFFFG